MPASNDSNFIRNYLAYTDGNEAPEMFHVWCAYGVLSSAIGRRVWMRHGEVAIYANIYVLLVCSAGGGKSYALDRARRMIAELGNVQCTYSVETVEGLINVLGGDPKAKLPSECRTDRVWPDGVTRPTHQIVITANEFIDMIRVAPESWTGFLNNIYDQDVYSYRTKNSGSQLLEGPYIVLLGAVPTEVSKALQDADIITTGLARRTIFQYGERRYNNPCPFPKHDQTNINARDACLLRLREIQNMEGELTLSEESRQWWITWYTKHSLDIPKKATPMTLGWLSSKPMQVQKLAMLNCLAMCDDKIIRPEHFELGLAYLDEMETTLHHIFGGTGRSELSRVVLALESYLNKQTIPVTFRKLKLVFFHQLASGRQEEELRSCLEHLYADKKAVSMLLTVGSISSEVIAANEDIIRQFVAGRSASSKVSEIPRQSVDVPPDSTPDSDGQSCPSPPPV